VRDAIQRAQNIGYMTRTRDAQILWASIYDQIDDEADGLFGAITARAEAQMLRLSVVYAALDGLSEINVDHVYAALAVWNYCEASAAYVFGKTIGDPVVDRLLKRIREAGSKGLTGQEQSAIFSRHVSADRLELARWTLGECGLITTTEEKTGGRPRIVSVAIKSEVREESEESL
jgi:hypothetical protein